LVTSRTEFLIRHNAATKLRRDAIDGTRRVGKRSCGPPRIGRDDLEFRFAGCHGQRRRGAVAAIHALRLDLNPVRAHPIEPDPFVQHDRNVDEGVQVDFAGQAAAGY